MDQDARASLRRQAPGQSATQEHLPMKSRVSMIIAAVLLGAVPALAMAAVTPIADARAGSGSVFTLRGTVTVAAGAFASSTFDQGFGLQDGTGGIYVTMPVNAGLGTGRQVRVSGTVGDDGYGLTVFRVAAVSDVRPALAQVDTAPRLVGTGEVGEATEGLLITVSGTVTRGPTDDMPYGYSVFIDDGSGETQVFMPASTGVNPFRIPFLKVGVGIRVTGFCGQYQSQYEVLPRVRADIEKLP